MQHTPPTRSADFVALTKPRVTLLVMVTTMFGFYLGSPDFVDGWLLLHTLLGTALAAGGTSALNMVVERDVDGKMHRTQNRPLPAHRLNPLEALIFASVIAVAGIVYLALAVNAMTGLLALLTLVSYVFLYTPLKKKSSLSTLVGSIPGALPPMGGWVAAHGAVTTEAWVLFGILFLWQLPHVLALTWLYREDFARGGFLMLPVMDPEGLYTSRHIIINCLALLPMSLLPTLIGMTGAVYFFGALTLGLGFLGFGIHVARQRSLASARRLLLASLIYLPVLFCLMSLDKVTL